MPVRPKKTKAKQGKRQILWLHIQHRSLVMKLSGFQWAHVTSSTQLCCPSTSLQGHFHGTYSFSQQTAYCATFSSILRSPVHLRVPLHSCMHKPPCRCSNLFTHCLPIALWNHGTRSLHTFNFTSFLPARQVPCGLHCHVLLWTWDRAHPPWTTAAAASVQLRETFSRQLLSGTRNPCVVV